MNGGATAKLTEGLDAVVYFLRCLMIPYIAVLFWALFVSTALRSPRDRLRWAGTGGPTSSASVATLVVLASLPLVLLHALRKDVGTDYVSYVRIYGAFSDGASAWTYEPLYSALNITAMPLGAAGIVVVFGVSAALSTIPVVWRIFHSSESPGLSLIALFGMAYPFLQTNVVRSVIAIAILFAALPAVWRGQPWRWFLAGVIAGGFHYTALLILPFYWILRWNVNIIIGIVAFVCAMLLAIYKPIGLIFLKFAPMFLPETYTKYPTQAAAHFDEIVIGPGLAWYVLSALLVLFFWRRTGLLGISERVIRNSFFLGLVIIIAAYQFRHVGRLGWFFYIAGVLYWPLIVGQVVNRDRSLVLLALIMVFSLLFWYASSIGAHDAVPYQWIVT